jgi:AcrR family transcriptional regulator
MKSSARLGRPVNADAERTRRRILLAAMTHVADVGYSRATMKSIAEQAELTSAAIYRYFPSKADLVLQALDDVFADVMGRLEVAAFSVEGFRARLVALLEEALACMADHPSMTRFEASLLFESTHSPEFAAAVGYRRHTEETLYRRLVVEAVEAGELPGHTCVQAMVDLLTSVSWGLTHLSVIATTDRHRAAIRLTESLLAQGFPTGS